MYDYETPAGSGDIFYTYVYNPAQNGLINGNTYTYLPIQVQDGDFALRVWAGANSVLASPLSTANLAVNLWGLIQLYDYRSRLFFDTPSAAFSFSNTGTAVVPEKVYLDNSAIRFDLINVELLKDVTGVVPVSQLAFHGVRRIKGRQSDPTPSPYRYKEVDFSIPFSFTLAGNGTAAGPGQLTQYTVQIQDFDFELRRIEYCASDSGEPVILQNGDIGSISFFGVPGTEVIAINQAGTPNLPFFINVAGNVVTLGASTDALGFSIMAAALVPPLIAANPAAAALITAVDPVADMPVMGSVIVTSSGSGGPALPNPISPEFQITLYDATWRARSNSPVNCNRLLHYNASNYEQSTGVGAPMNSYPSPGILYPVNSVIRFDILSLVPSTASNPNPSINLVFKGVRRLPC